jgi:hypothetical protein
MRRDLIAKDFKIWEVGVDMERYYIDIGGTFLEIL